MNCGFFYVCVFCVCVLCFVFSVLLNVVLVYLDGVEIFSSVGEQRNISRASVVRLNICTYLLYINRFHIYILLKPFFVLYIFQTMFILPSKKNITKKKNIYLPRFFLELKKQKWKLVKLLKHIFSTSIFFP